MIQPIQFNNISFRGEDAPIERLDSNLVEEYAPGEPTPVDSAELSTTKKQLPEPKEKYSIKEYLKATRDCCIDFLKKINESYGLISGTTKGAIAGSITTLGIAFVGKNIQLAKGNIASTLKYMGSDLIKGLKGIIHIAPDLIKKAPIDNLKSAIGTPKNFYKEYLKNAKATGGIATAAGLGVFVLNMVKARVKTNVRNAGIEHGARKSHATVD